MQIMSHRGYWRTVEEKNTAEAFTRSFSLGFGTETDVRDYHGDLVISHDIADERAMSVERFFSLFAQYDLSLPLALNVKADGLQQKIKFYLNKFNVENYFFFDMSIPDCLQYIEAELTTFIRFSEYETDLSLLPLAQGVWLDGFEKDVVEESKIARWLEQGKKVCIVSPELHKRESQPFWSRYRSFSNDILTSHDLLLCTDIPELATEFFHE
jgi:glycerophosphoryl diester phosphodiesterase